MSSPSSQDLPRKSAAAQRRLLRWIGWASSVYLFGLTVYLILYFTIGENFVVVAFFNHALMWLLIAALPATVGCLLVFRCRSDR